MVDPKSAKFIESIEVHVALAIDPKHPRTCCFIAPLLEERGMIGAAVETRRYQIVLYVSTSNLSSSLGTLSIL